MDNLTDIRDKYLNDVTHINDYVQYLETFFLAFIRKIDNLETVTPTLFADPLISNLCEKNALIQGEMVRYLDRASNEMRSLNIKEKSPGEPCDDDPTPEGDIIASLLLDIRKGETNPEILFQNAQINITAMCMTKGPSCGFEGYYILNDNPQKIRQLVEIAIEEEKRKKYEALNAEKAYICMSAQSLELFDSSNQINLYKQNFIQIMAYFDSCIFDMVRFCMSQNFFKWLSYFENVSIKTHDMAVFNDYDSFKEAQIEFSLKKCYIKDLLHILHHQFNQIFTIDGTDVYHVLQEMIGRRNVHVHHNGFADQMYLDKFNVYRASLGDYLQIDKEYFEKAVDTTQKVVSSIASICV